MFDGLMVDDDELETVVELGETLEEVEIVGDEVIDSEEFVALEVELVEVVCACVCE